MADPATTLESAFAPPRTQTRPTRARVRRDWWFVIRRGIRLLVGPTVLAACVALVFGIDDRVRLAVTWLSCLVVWLPTTVIQFRVAFFPSAPDPWLSTDDDPVSDRDLRALYRSEVADFVLGSMPALWLATWFATDPRIVSGTAVGVAIVLGLMLLVRNLHVVRTLLFHEASLDLAAGEADRARRWLERALRWPLPGMGDRARVLLARARFYSGDVHGALDALQQVRQPRAWQVKPLRAQMAIGLDGPDAARAVAAELRGDPAQLASAEALEILADLYEDRDDRVLARADALLSLPRDDARRVVILLLAAAMARTEPEQARRLLAEIRWDPVVGGKLARPWPPVAARLSTLDAGAHRSQPGPREATGAGGDTNGATSRR